MGSPHYHWKQNLVTSDILEDYRVRLTPGWVKSLSDAALPSLKLNDVVSDFLMGLRTVEVTAGMPYALVTQLKSFVDGYTRNDKRDPVAKTAAMLITQRLAAELDVSSDVRQQIAVKCLQIGAEIHHVELRGAPPFSLQQVWANYYGDKGFRMSLWESQRLGLISAYNWYDIFLKRCLKVALGGVVGRCSDEKLTEKIEATFGKPTCDVCWNNDAVQLYREARHAITHTGGRETPKLIKIGHPFAVVDEVVQILPRHLIELLRTIESAAESLVAAALAHPRFRNKQKRAKAQ